MILIKPVNSPKIKMNWFRKHHLILLAIGLALPLGIAFLYYDFYDNNDLILIKQISMADQGDLLSILRKNPKVFVSVVKPFEMPGIKLFGTKAFHYVDPASFAQMSSPFRC
jgi:hypothetical protein